MNCNSSNELYSFHPGGCMVAMCDGSVRFLAAQTPLSVVAAFVSTQLSEINPSDE
jgi:prepilin-type processing-associated H-X9-DG protein